MSKKLLLVESPNKIPTISKYLPGFKVLASCGHVCDLAKNDYVDIDNNFKPKYIVVKKDVVKRIKDAMVGCSEVIIGTDLDREGEAIGSHLLRVLKLPKNTKRIIFNEITKSALTKAINNPTVINNNIFNAYQARIILDKWLGWNVCPVLWKYVKDRTSAGRCQSPALMLVLDKEEEIDKFKEKKYFSVETEFHNDEIKETNIIGKLTKKINNKDELNKMIDIIKNSNGIITSVITKIKKIYPPKPYITSSVQQDASQLLGLSPQICNNILKKLYEKAKITYPRTDLDELSDEAKQNCKEVIIERFGKKYLSNNKQKRKKKENTQEAHEAIRPVDIELSEVDDLNDLEQKMYYMIWKRTIQSQMSNKENEILDIAVQLNNKKNNEIKYDYNYIINYVNCKFDGFTIINKSQKNNLDINKIKDLFKVGNYLEISSTTYNEQFTKPKNRLTEADLIKLIESKGIGRPSTFASIIKTLSDRNYIEIKNTECYEIECEQIIQTANDVKSKIITKIIPVEKRKIFITELGKSICIFLKENFKIMMDYEYTSNVNKKLDIISDGKLIWHDVVREQYNIFNPIIAKLLSNIPNSKENSELIGEINNIQYYKYKGKWGWTVKWNTNNKAEYIKIPDNLLKKIENIKINDIKDIIPINIGLYQKYHIYIKEGQYGSYINWNKKNISIKNKNISLEEAVNIINDNDKNNDKKKNTKVLKEIKQYKIINGQYGIFITNGQKNKKLNGNIEVKDINLKYCNNLFKYKK